jgi:chromosome condensin MukBEF ATPase and DNA-binding subunit MukB
MIEHDPASDPADDVREALREAQRLIDRLDADNERLRMKVLDLMRFMEAAVTERVDHELRAEALEAELHALQHTKIMRAVAPLRRIYAGVTRRVRRVRGRRP